MKTKIYHDLQHGHAASIESVKMRPWKGARKKTGYRVTALLVENNFIYYVACFDTLLEAKAALRARCFDV